MHTQRMSARRNQRTPRPETTGNSRQDNVLLILQCLICTLQCNPSCWTAWRTTSLSARRARAAYFKAKPSLETAAKTCPSHSSVSHLHTPVQILSLGQPGGPRPCLLGGPEQQDHSKAKPSLETAVKTMSFSFFSASSAYFSADPLLWTAWRTTSLSARRAGAAYFKAKPSLETAVQDNVLLILQCLICILQHRIWTPLDSPEDHVPVCSESRRSVLQGPTIFGNSRQDNVLIIIFSASSAYSRAASTKAFSWTACEDARRA